MDITYLNKIYPKNESNYKYILCFIDHFSKFSKTYLLKNKTSEEVLIYIKSFIKEVGKTQILQYDNGGEFLANIIKKFLEEEGIIYVNSSPHHPHADKCGRGI